MEMDDEVDMEVDMEMDDDLDKDEKEENRSQGARWWDSFMKASCKRERNTTSQNHQTSVEIMYYTHKCLKQVWKLSHSQMSKQVWKLCITLTNV